MQLSDSIANIRLQQFRISDVRILTEGARSERVYACTASYQGQINEAKMMLRVPTQLSIILFEGIYPSHLIQWFIQNIISTEEKHRVVEDTIICSYHNYIQLILKDIVAACFFVTTGRFVTWQKG